MPATGTLARWEPRCSRLWVWWWPLGRKESHTCFEPTSSEASAARSPAARSVQARGVAPPGQVRWCWFRALTAWSRFRSARPRSASHGRPRLHDSVLRSSPPAPCGQSSRRPAGCSCSTFRQGRCCLPRTLARRGTSALQPLPRDSWSRRRALRSRRSLSPAKKSLALDASQQVRHLDRRLRGLGALVVLGTGARQRLLLVLGGQHPERDRNSGIELDLHDSGRGLARYHLEVKSLAADHAPQTNDGIVLAFLGQGERSHWQFERAWDPVNIRLSHLPGLQCPQRSS